MTSFQTSEGEQQQAFLYSNIVDSTFPHQPKAGGPPFLSRTGNVLYAFIRANIQELTFHQTNYCSRLQTIRWFRQSDWKPVGLPIRLKELRTFSYFPLVQLFPLASKHTQICPITLLCRLLFTHKKAAGCVLSLFDSFRSLAQNLSFGTVSRICSDHQLPLAGSLISFLPQADYP